MADSTGLVKGFSSKKFWLNVAGMTLAVFFAFALYDATKTYVLPKIMPKA